MIAMIIVIMNQTRYSVNNIDNPVVATPVAYTETDLTAVADESVVMTYKMLGTNNKETQATALLFTPKGTPPAKVGL